MQIKIFWSLILLLPGVILSSNIRKSSSSKENVCQENTGHSFKQDNLLEETNSAETQEEETIEPDRPNVIIFLVDDLGYGDTGFSGHPTSRTPNIDADLFEKGKFLTNFYVTSPVCSPSRASFLTGRYQVRSGIYPSIFYPQSALGLPRRETTIANILKNVGYRTKLVGKWHLGVGYRREFLPGDGAYGFDDFYGTPYSQDMCPCPVCFPNNGSCLTPCWNTHVSCALFRNKEIIEQPVYLPAMSQRLLKEASQFIAKSSRDGDPFFLFMSFLHIHDPQFASSKFFNQNDRGVTGDSLLELDWLTGEILDLLEILNIDNNTLIWFTSDNGPSLGSHESGGCAGLLRCGKGTTWEGGIRVPAIIRWPGKVNPGKSNALASSLDILPTIAKLVGAEDQIQNLTLDGMDISSVLLDDTDESPRTFFAAYPQSPEEDVGPLAVIYKQYKAHFYTKGSFLSDNDNYDPMCIQNHNLTKHDPPLLFDIYEDPGERYNIAQKNESIPILELMTAWRQKHMAEIKWAKPRTRVFDSRSEPCCTTPSCEPFPQCCDCAASASSEVFEI